MKIPSILTQLVSLLFLLLLSGQLAAAIAIKPSSSQNTLSSSNQWDDISFQKIDKQYKKNQRKVRRRAKLKSFFTQLFKPQKRKKRSKASKPGLWFGFWLLSWLLAALCFLIAILAGIPGVAFSGLGTAIIMVILAIGFILFGIVCIFLWVIKRGEATKEFRSGPKD